jgi:hypothetical protein
MGLRTFLHDLFAPRWQHSTSAVRLRAIHEQPLTEDVLLALIANPAELREVKLAALSKLPNAQSIRTLVTLPDAATIMPDILARVDDRRFLSGVHAKAQCCSSPLYPIHDALHRRILELDLQEVDASTDSFRLLKIGLSHSDVEVRRKALARIEDPHVVAAQIGMASRHKDDKSAALFGCTKPEHLPVLLRLLDVEAVFWLAQHYPGHETAFSTRLAELGRKLTVRVLEDDKICPNCGGKGGSTCRVRVPYTDHDWEDEYRECSTCNDTGRIRTRRRICTLAPAEPIPGDSGTAEIAAVERWLAAHPRQLDRALADGGTLLHLAVRAANVPLVAWLLAHGSSMEVPEPDKKYTPLHVALESLRDVPGQKAIVAVLVAHGANLETSLKGAGTSPIGLVRKLGLDRELFELVEPPSDKKVRLANLANEQAQAARRQQAVAEAVGDLSCIDDLMPEAALVAIRNMARHLCHTESLDDGYGLSNQSVIVEDQFSDALGRIGFARDAKGWLKSAHFTVCCEYFPGYTQYLAHVSFRHNEQETWTQVL